MTRYTFAAKACATAMGPVTRQAVSDVYADVTRWYAMVPRYAMVRDGMRMVRDRTRSYAISRDTNRSMYRYTLVHYPPAQALTSISTCECNLMRPSNHKDARARL